jgi:hypothetical protein
LNVESLAGRNPGIRVDDADLAEAPAAGQRQRHRATQFTRAKNRDH